MNALTSPRHVSVHIFRNAVWPQCKKHIHDCAKVLSHFISYIFMFSILSTTWSKSSKVSISAPLSSNRVFVLYKLWLSQKSNDKKITQIGEVLNPFGQCFCPHEWNAGFSNMGTFNHASWGLQEGWVHWAIIWHISTISFVLPSVAHMYCFWVVLCLMG